jgi:hypothetical protein
MLDSKRVLREENEQLRNDNEQLRAEVAEIKHSATFHLAQDLERDMETIVTTDSIAGEDIAMAQDEAIARRRAELIAKRTDALVGENVAIAIEAARHNIEEEAQRAAAVMAAQAVARFMEEGGPAYRAAVQERLARRKTAAGIAAVRHQILTEEQEASGESREDTYLLEETHEQLKQRAKELRKRTSKSHLLPLDWLMEDDVITLTFVKKGQGYESLTMDGGYWNNNRSYRSDLEQRKVTCRLLDRENGVIEVEADSWLESSENRSNALRAGRQMVIVAENPDTKEIGALLVKGAPVEIQDLDGNSAHNDNLDLWWVNVGDFRAMS